MTGIWLGIETSAVQGGVALVKSNSVASELLLPEKTLHSEKLIPAVCKLLEEAGVRGEELAGIGVSAGPGSYTGLRIGIATALGLAEGWRVPVRGVSTLRIVASAAPDQPVLACIRARRGEVFAAVFRSPDPLSEAILPPALFSVQSLTEIIVQYQCVAIGSGRSEFQEIELPGVEWVPGYLDPPGAGRTGLCAAAEARVKGFHQKVEPLYLRKFNQRIED